MPQIKAYLPFCDIEVIALVDFECTSPGHSANNDDPGSPPEYEIGDISFGFPNRRTIIKLPWELEKAASAWILDHCGEAFDEANQE